MSRRTSRKGGMTPFAKILLILVVLVGMYFGFNYVKEATATPIKIGVVTWPGYAGGQYFNGGFEASKESRYYTELGILVEFKVLDDFSASRNAFRAGEVDLLWSTMDAYPTEVEGMKDFDIKVVFQSDWSRGGDNITVSRTIKNPRDLMGKKIAVAYATPSHTFLLWYLDSNGIKLNQVTIVEVDNPIVAAELFKAKEVDAAVLWSPFEEECMEAVPGSKVLTSTEDATHIIADIFYAKDEYIKKNKEKISKLIEGWMIGASEINSDRYAKGEAIDILTENLGSDFDARLIDKVRLCTLGDNKRFFGLDHTYNGIDGEKLYVEMAKRYAEIDLCGRVPMYKSVVDASFIKNLNLVGAEHNAEPTVKFTKATSEDMNKEAFANKPITINFASGQYVLDDISKETIDKEFVDIAKVFTSSRIRVEGNTDNVGNHNMNVNLSRKRAQSVVDYLVNEYGFDVNRFIVVGNGPDNPVSENNTPEGRNNNRRTEFKLVK